MPAGSIWDLTRGFKVSIWLHFNFVFEIDWLGYRRKEICSNREVTGLSLL